MACEEAAMYLNQHISGWDLPAMCLLWAWLHELATHPMLQPRQEVGTALQLTGGLSDTIPFPLTFPVQPEEKKKNTPVINEKHGSFHSSDESQHCLPSLRLCSGLTNLKILSADPLLQGV